ncbi:MAG: hypothetical protein H8E10_08155 [Desulfobacterales bacterium]|nr:hypothetical protein [Desulfobacterales bacterium]
MKTNLARVQETTKAMGRAFLRTGPLVALVGLAIKMVSEDVEAKGGKSRFLKELG